MKLLVKRVSPDFRKGHLISNVGVPSESLGKMSNPEQGAIFIYFLLVCILLREGDASGCRPRPSAISSPIYAHASLLPSSAISL